MDEFEPGDQLRVHGPLFAHVGMFLGDGAVFHAPKGGTARIDDYDTFAEGHTPELVSRLPVEDRYEAVKRALGLVGQPYDALMRNCEHAVSYAQTGEASSPTLRALAGLAIVGGLLWAGTRG